MKYEKNRKILYIYIYICHFAVHKIENVTLIEFICNYFGIYIFMNNLTNMYAYTNVYPHEMG